MEQGDLIMPLTRFFNKNEPKTVLAESLEKCPSPTTDWTDKRPDYSEVKDSPAPVSTPVSTPISE